MFRRLDKILIILIVQTKYATKYLPPIEMQNIKQCIWKAVSKKGTACRNKRGGLLYNAVYELAIYGAGGFVICSLIYIAIN